jgi:plastocyanin
MNTELRDRVVLPLAIPLGALALIGVFVFSFSRILLVVPRQLAPAVALAAALDILVVCAIVANRPASAMTYRLAAAMALASVLAGGYAFSLVGFNGERAKAEVAAPEGGAPAAVAAPAGVRITAKGIAFDKKDIALRSGGEAEIDFRNDDAATPHNVAIYKDSFATEVIFKGDLVTGPATKTYKFAAPPAGSYYFRCDVHPTMQGTVTVT